MGPKENAQSVVSFVEPFWPPPLGEKGVFTTGKPAYNETMAPVVKDIGNCLAG
jgi:hypothetical protein